jgi:hypothetical protein
VVDAHVAQDVAGPVQARRVGRLGMQLGRAGAIARSASVSGSSTSYSTTIASAARRAVSGWSAATIATGSPW